MANYNLREVLKQLGRNILSWVKSNCVNNCVSTTTNLPLAAAQGKALQDQITSLNSNIKTMFIDYNTLIDGIVVSSTTNLCPIPKGKNLSDYKFLVFTVLDGGSFRNPSILPTGMFGSPIELDYSSPTAARYVEFEKVNDSAIKIHGSGSSNPKAYVFGLKITCP